ncbi:putative DNL zinc finger domain containing protein [Drepanopeziza brunnea f. sp. 'multigermtubi' MB_m1]|uniref:Putative DNL zinc finger domain containing protein n=1 Tax=Marssonina brunnea f. sp. multigermtubi (strain MB_m1) TaxID=1072389 RepID=K1Y603_MARBU|nr:putative DNL zinc finger domain containing protein [Drepanopeziza brunnea f. sp. 'multigermtubi' MB_m1]EKD20614.1 putative DNL zinc finger domain containing protein [Drepanopeziza brunnea f. sp. 'multigermtubi' MB_m1]
MKPPTLLCAIRAFSRLPRSKPLCTHLTAVRFVQTPSPSPPPRHFSTTPLRPSTYTPSPSSSPSPSPLSLSLLLSETQKTPRATPSDIPNGCSTTAAPQARVRNNIHLHALRCAKYPPHQQARLPPRERAGDMSRIFGDKHMTIEDLMREQGQLVKKGTLSDDGDLEFWADGTTTARGSGSGTGGEEGEKRD